MTETQAKSGASGTSTTPVDEEPAEGGAPATGRAAVGRAVVPAEPSSSPKFTRAPGMAPPPDEPSADSKGPSEPAQNAGGNAKASATVPIVTKAKKAAAAVTELVKDAIPTKEERAGATAAPAKGASPAGRGTVTAPTRPGVTGDSPRVRPGGSAAGAAAVGAARVTDAVRAARTTVTSAAARGPRRARLNLKRIDPWSVMKFSFAVSVVLFIVVIVATSVLYLALDAMGVWEEVNRTLGDLVSAGGGASTGGFRITAWGVIGTSMLIGAVNVVLFTALATLGAFIYNVCADLVGGVELTLAERD